MQRRAGISRHDAVVWGFARGASALGVDIIQNCEVTGFEISGESRAQASAPHKATSQPNGLSCPSPATPPQLARLAGLELPITTMASAGDGHRARQTGARCRRDLRGRSCLCQPERSWRDRDRRRRRCLQLLRQRGGLPSTASGDRRGPAAVSDLQPAQADASMGRARWTSRRTRARSWDSPRSKACTSIAAGAPAATKRFRRVATRWPIPWPQDKPHPLIAAFALDRFERGALIDEGAAAGVAH